MESVMFVNFVPYLAVLIGGVVWACIYIRRTPAENKNKAIRRVALVFGLALGTVGLYVLGMFALFTMMGSFFGPNK